MKVPHLFLARLALGAALFLLALTAACARPPVSILSEYAPGKNYLNFSVDRQMTNSTWTWYWNIHAPADSPYVITDARIYLTYVYVNYPNTTYLTYQGSGVFQVGNYVGTFANASGYESPWNGAADLPYIRYNRIDPGQSISVPLTLQWNIGQPASPSTTGCGVHGLGYTTLVPEPSSAAVMLLGLCGLLRRRSRKG